jgi:hypothetical protein
VTTHEQHEQTAPLAFPLALTTNALDAGSIVIESDLSDGTLAMLSGNSAITVKITDPQGYAQAADELAKVKGVAKRIEEQRKELTKPLDEEKARVMNYVRPFTDALSRVEGAIKKGLGEYDAEQERKQRLAQAEAEERARKEQERLEKRAETAESSGKTEKADALREQATTMVYAAPAQAAAAPAVKGLSKTKKYSGECTDLMALAKACVAQSLLAEAGGDPAKLMQIVNAHAQTAAPLKLITADTKVIGQMVTALKEDFNYPGIRVTADNSYSSRAK